MNKLLLAVMMLSCSAGAQMFRALPLKAPSAPILPVAPALTAPSLMPAAPRLAAPASPLAGLWAQVAQVQVPNAAIASPAAASQAPIPSWFDASGLSFVLLRRDSDGFTMAILRRGRYELAIFLDRRGGEVATFTKYSLNPMGTPQKEDVVLQSLPNRRAIADILRRAPEPAHAAERAALEAILALLS